MNLQSRQSGRKRGSGHVELQLRRQPAVRRLLALASVLVTVAALSLVGTTTWNSVPQLASLQILLQSSKDSGE